MRFDIGLGELLLAVIAVVLVVAAFSDSVDL